MAVGALFLDWAGLGVDEAGEPVHVPTVEGDKIVCRCHQQNCQLDRALWRCWAVGYLAAIDQVARSWNEAGG